MFKNLHTVFALEIHRLHFIIFPAAQQTSKNQDRVRMRRKLFLKTSAEKCLPTTVSKIVLLRVTLNIL